MQNWQRRLPNLSAFVRLQSRLLIELQIAALVHVEVIELSALNSVAHLGQGLLRQRHRDAVAFALEGFARARAGRHPHHV